MVAKALPVSLRCAHAIPDFPARGRARLFRLFRHAEFPRALQHRATQPIAVVARDREGTRRFRLMRWGLLPSFVKDPKQFPTLINARSEYVLVKASFRNAMRWRRCLVPADGFYEWTGEKGKRRQFLLRPREPHLIAFAGIYER